ncbi:uncharacterized protein LOC120286262 isoform X4 [Eucalyptus grandis]|uniref:uncharacterized protein LOC120286262 isoform X4 n=1 Tax=Eucalyptus grandis TaxID=71139 RepID=UPI00192F0C7C|nr:uncharacterized protein LOC120286262 isoform X4 [Eucalyptus grandis]
MPAVRFLPTAVLLSGWLNGEGRRSGQRRREDRRKWNGRAPPRVLGLPIVSPASSPSQEPQMSEYCNTAYAGVLSQVLYAQDHHILINILAEM